METEEIKKLISQAKIRKALVALDKIIDKEDPRKKELILLSSQYNMLERDEMMGLLMQSDVQLSKKKIISELLELFT